MLDLTERLEKFNEDYLSDIDPDQPLNLDFPAKHLLNSMLQDAGYVAVKDQKGLHKRITKEGVSGLVTSVEFFDENDLTSTSDEKGFSYIRFSQVNFENDYLTKEGIRWQFVPERAKALRKRKTYLKETKIATSFGGALGLIGGMTAGMAYDSLLVLIGSLVATPLALGIPTYIINRRKFNKEEKQAKEFRKTYGSYILTNKQAINSALETKKI